MIGCYKARCVPVNLNYRYVAPELRYVVDNADLEVLRVRARARPAGGRGTGGPVPERPLHLLVLEDGTPRDPDPVTAATGGTRPATRRPWPARPDAALRAPRSPDDRYILYTGGTTGMPKGVLWRQEDIFFAAMGGGGWGRTPIATPDELAGRHRHRRVGPRADAGRRAPHARERPVGDVERLHDGRNGRPLHAPPLRPRPAAAPRRRGAGGVGRPGR